jgi:MoxR-like ATPase
MLKCKITKLAETVYPLIHADIPVMIKGPTGVGKSAVINSQIMSKIRTDFGEGAKLHDIRLSTKDIVDGTGMPLIDREKMATYWTRPAFVPEDDGEMHVMFFDEFGHANVQLQQMSYQLVLDRSCGGYKLPQHNRVILGSNTREDGGGDNKMLKPLENRMAHVQVEIDEVGFTELTKEWGWDKRLIAFIQLRPELIHKVDVNHPSFPTPRSLENFNKVLRDSDKLGLDQRTLKAVLENAALAILGEGFARQFASFLDRLAAGLPKIADILADPAKAKVPGESHFQYLMAGTIARNMTAKNAPIFAKYLARLLPDIASMCVSDAIGRDKALKDIPQLKDILLEGSGK